MSKLIIPFLGLVFLFASCQEEIPTPNREILGIIDTVSVDTLAKVHKDTLDLSKLKSKVLKKVTQKAFSDKNVLTVTASLAAATGGKAYQVKDLQKLLPAIMEVLDDNLKDKTDVVFLIDKTGSMSDDIAKVKEHVALLIKCLGKFSKVKTAVVLYGDQNADGAGWLTFDSLRADHKKSLLRLTNVSVTGGGDWPESANDALAEVINKTNWTAGSSRMVLLIGDAPSLEPPNSKHSTSDIIKLCKAKSVVANIYPILFSLEKVAGTVEPKSLIDALYKDASMPNPEIAATNRINKIYPNPVEIDCNIELLEENSVASVLVMDMTGNILKTETFSGKTHRLDLRRVPPGNYLVRVSGESPRWTDSKKIIVVR